MIMVFRKYQPSDCEKIADLFYHTVHTINAKDYTKEQLMAWTSGLWDLTVLNQSLLSHMTVVAVDDTNDDLIVGFGDMDETGYLDRLYVHKDYQNQGIASEICDILEHTFPVHRITTHASITAKPFFMHRGYRVVREQQVTRKGVLLTNFVMEKAMKREGDM